MIIKELKNGWNNNGLYVPNNETNNDYQEIKKYIAEGGEYEKFDWLADAKTQKINELNTFIFAEKTKPYTTFTAPELVPSIVNGKTQFKQSEPVSFIWYVDAIPNSKLTPESILNKCNLDMTSCIKASILDVKSIDLASLKANLKICLDSKIIPYTTTITKNGVQLTGMVNVFPIAESLANHIQQREVNSNVLNNVYLSQINNCKTIDEVNLIKFTTGA
jgi:hypothetical protein